MALRARLFFILSLCVLLAGCVATPVEEEKGEGVLFSASFYPVYLAALQIAGDVDEVRIEMFLQPQGGYLEDFQLSELDWARTMQADALLMMGGGLEEFLPVFLAEGNRPMLVAGEYIDHLPGRILDPDEDTAPAPNPYTWLSPRRWARIVDGMAAGLAQLDPERAEAYIAANNAAQVRIEQMGLRLVQKMALYQGRPVVVAHPALAYLAQDAGLDVVFVIERDPSMLPFPWDITGLEELLVPHAGAVLLLEQEAPLALHGLGGLPTALCETLSVGIRDGDPMAWEHAMEHNLRVLGEALAE
ncbi:MAG: metal ABC transporter substrate-binding protein [Clostridia bacterium]|nr:metal ABC transporter substrate-binding protein [Clostridia bacterium]